MTFSGLQTEKSTQADIVFNVQINVLYLTLLSVSLHQLASYKRHFKTHSSKKKCYLRKNGISWANNSYMTLLHRHGPNFKHSSKHKNLTSSDKIKK